MKAREPQPSKILNVLVWLTILPTLIGEFFKTMHWPAAALLLTLGTFAFGFFYLPLFTIESWKNKETVKAKILLLLQSAFLLMFSLGFLFKIMHWPGAAIFYYVNNFLILFFVIPFALFHLGRARKAGINSTHHILLVIYFFIHYSGTLMLAGSGKINVHAVLQQGINSEIALKAATSRNNQLYLTLAKVNLSDKSDMQTKGSQLKNITDSAFVHIQDLKSHLLMRAAKISRSVADTLSSINLGYLTGFDIPNMILIGDVYNPNKDKYSASQLKQVINAFRDSLLSLVQEQNRTIIKEGLNLNTDNTFDEDGEPLSWEMANFYSMPMVYVYTTLTNIQYEIKNAEFQALTDIINAGNKELNTALFQQVSDLNAKFDAMKKQEEIKKLQNENVKGMELLSAKDSELSETKQTIVFFALVILLFVVLVFFVVRSNYLRLQTNNTLHQQKEIIASQKTEVEAQKHLIEEKQKEILDSISYAKRLQEAILPPQDFIDKHIPDNFILYKPKDLVAGDFYWAEKVDELFFIAAADSTGHGVPGAMVSVVCSNALNRSVKEFGLREPGKILDKTRELVVETFEKSADEVKDGMDISLLCLDMANKKISWSGANNALWYFQNGELRIINPDKQPIGKSEKPKPFTTHVIDYVSGTTYYLFTDGFADQFGGPIGKKYNYKQLREKLSTIVSKSAREQYAELERSFEEWKGDLEQVDDVCVIGVRI